MGGLRAGRAGMRAGMRAGRAGMRAGMRAGRQGKAGRRDTYNTHKLVWAKKDRWC